MDHTFKDWLIYISPNLHDSEYAATETLNILHSKDRITFDEDLHLSVSLRSFRAERLSSFIKNILDIQPLKAKADLDQFKDKYPIVLTRDLLKAKQWLKDKARGSERYGMVVSSQALRLKPFAIDVKSPMNHVNWFLDGKEDVRSSFYLEDVATEFQIQGLELDWSCVVWDGDLRFSTHGWQTYSFKGNKWQNINSKVRKQYLLTALS